MRKIRYSFLILLFAACHGDPPPDEEPVESDAGIVAPPGTGGMNLGGSAPMPGTGGAGGMSGGGPGTGGVPPGPAMGGSGGRGPDAGPAMNPPNPPSPIGPSPMSLPVYDESKVVDLFLTFAPGEWEKLLNLQMAEDDTRWARCSFTFQGQAYPEAHCRRKGTPEIWAIEKKPQIVVRFNLINKQGRFRGLRRLNLEYFDQDVAAPIRDRLGMWIMREAGLDAPRVNHARVFKDGAMLGLYMNIDAIDKEFLEDHFGAADSNGNLWESGWDLKTNEDMPNQTRLEALNALVANEPLNGDHTNFFAQLDAMMDIDQVLLEMAAETAALTDDNFSNGAENFFYYDHPKRGFLVLPWDLDTIYSADPKVDVFAFWEPSPNKLRQLMNQNPAWRTRFVERLIDIRDRVITKLPAKAKQVCDQVAAYVYADSNRRPSYTDFLDECTFWQERPQERIAEIKNQLGR
jgi:hypothetical protein